MVALSKASQWHAMFSHALSIMGRFWVWIVFLSIYKYKSDINRYISFTVAQYMLPYINMVHVVIFYTCQYYNTNLLHVTQPL